jgi:hypothetical protein
MVPLRKTNPFLDKARPPTPAEVEQVLGRAAERWKRLREQLDAEFGALTPTWTYSGKAYGWSLRLSRGKRAVLYLLPREGGVLAAFALGEKACAAAEEAGLSNALLEALANAPRYAEGRGVRIEVNKLNELAGVLALARLKLAH